MAQPFKHPVTGIYYLRRRVPQDLRAVLGHEYKRSLGTRDPHEAKRKHALEWGNCEAAFALARAQSQGDSLLTPRDAQVLAGRWYQQELNAMEKSGDFGGWLAWETTGATELGDQHEEHGGPITLREALDGDLSAADEQVHGYISLTLKNAQLPTPVRNSSQYAALHSAFLDHYFRLGETALQRHAGDWQSHTGIVDAPLSIERERKAKANGRRLMAVFEEYAEGRMLMDKKSRAVMSTLTEYRALVGEFTELTEDPPVGEITRAIVRLYRGEAAKLPSKGKGIRKLGAKARIAKAESEGLPQITSATLSNKLRALSSVLSYAVRMQYISENPVVAGQFLRESSRAVRAERAANKKRTDYNEEELRAIFTSPIYSVAGWRPPRAEFGEAWYWMPLLMYYTGARLEELAQLHVADVGTEQPHPFLSILNAEGSEDGKRGVKTANSRRDIPLHPDLVKLGFLRYVEGVSGGQLFPGLSADPKGYFGSNFGRRWANYLRTVVNLQSPAHPSHGFRHTFKSMCREVGIPEDVHDAITGHAGGNAVARGYGGMSLLAKGREIARLPTAPGLVLVDVLEATTKA